MKVGDLVKVKDGDVRIRRGGPFPVGIVTDVMERDDGWCHFEVVYTLEGRQERHWLSDLQMEIINEGR